MKFFIYIVFSILICTYAQAQITGPDTVCMHVPVQFSTLQKATTYTWVFDTVNIKQTPSSATLSASGGSLNVPAFASMNYDSGSWYAFVTNYSNNHITRVSYGSDPNSASPTLTDMGTFGLNSGETEGIDVLKDSATGNWYGFVVGGSQFLRLSFGVSLSNFPSDTMMNFSSAFAWPHQLNIKKFGTQYVGFVANRSGHITRLDFGSSLTNVPTATNLPYVGSYSGPCNFALYEESGNWYMLVTNLTNNTMSLLSFGSNIQNDTPSGSNLGSFSLLSLPRSVTFIKSCNKLLAYAINESGELIRLDFNGTIDNTPTATDMGNLSTSSDVNAFTTYVHDSTQYLLIVSTGYNALYRQGIITYPSYDTSIYYKAYMTHSFASTGLYHISLFCDQAFFMGPSAFCKTVYVVDSGTKRLWNDTSLCAGGIIHLSAASTGATSYLWSTGATTPTITVISSGTYWVQLSGVRCAAANDTINVHFIAHPLPDLGGDTAICKNGSVTLSPGLTGSGYTYHWNNGNTSNSINVNTPGQYWVQVTDSGCSGSDTVMVTQKPSPTVFIGNDTTICAGDTLILNASAEPNGTTYLWNTGDTNPYIKIDQKGFYSLAVTYNGCTGTDSMFLNITHIPHIDLGPDTTLCNGETITIPLYADSGIINWFNGTTKKNFIVDHPGIYSAEIENQCGFSADTIDVKYMFCDLWFPSAFSPNSDGRNDIARALGNLDGITNFNLTIYNRWGQVVYYTDNPYDGWNGTLNGIPQEVGAYYYMIRYHFRGKAHLIKGDITLIR